jgi:putative phosphoribosyl transferase
VTQTTSERTISFRAGATALEGTVSVPSGARGIVVFAHGSGSGRHSPRNRHVAAVLNDAGLATLLIDLLSEDEERVDRATGELRFDVGLLAERLLSATDWVAADEETSSLPVGYFGASTGAAAALMAGAARPTTAAVVSRGGRPDLAERVLDEVDVPTLLIVGERDTEVVELNRKALERLPGAKALEIVPGATHLFEEPGALDEVARLAGEWFMRYLGR